MTLNRRTFIGGALASAALPGLGGADGRIARVGLMTDTHVKMTLASCAKVRAALELFKAQGAELVVNCGDIANRHYPEGYRLYRQTVNEVYPDPATRPQELFVYAAHDVNNYKPGSTPPPETKKSFGVLVVDVYADRLVFRRHDIRDRSECAAPWIVRSRSLRKRRRTVLKSPRRCALRDLFWCNRSAGVWTVWRVHRGTGILPFGVG